MASAPSNDLWIAALTLSIVFLTILWYKLNKEESRLPPGPRGLPIVGFLPFLRTNLHHQLTELSQQFGPIYKFWLGGKLCVVLNSPSLAKEVVRDQDSIFANRDPPIAGLVATYGGLDIGFSPYGSYWRDMRKLFVREMLSNRNLEACYSLRRHEVRKTIRNVHTKIGSLTDIGELAFVTEMNVIMSMIFGSNFVEKMEKHKKDGTEFRELVIKYLQILGKPNISDFFPMLARFDLQGIQKDAEALLKSVESILDPAINEHLKMLSDRREGEIQGNEKKNFIQILLELMEQKDIGISLDLVKIKSILVDIVIGGTDSTITTVEWVMTELLNNPETMSKVQQELKHVVGMNNIVEESHLLELHYLDAVLKETLRLHPALPLLLPKRPSQSAIVGGYTIPEGTKVFLNVYAIHRDPQVWESPLEFQPERFLSRSTNLDYAGNNMKYLPFGSGRRICAGLPLAEKMVMFMLASLLHSFDWKLPEGEKVDLSEGFGLVIKKSERLFAIPTPRLPNFDLYQ
ncbi:labd-13Z-ene-9,15,16-triol synthase, chloroplastic-like isoform X1 [Solanum stenotomum]|uniref:labd-13Z-ene-9,15,16-triol synthase, chloroplastic-like isoform X1 n=1 Tax=Solanum stenotomum TaxID=172797 RepID=UPI0020D1D86D|nr:labd-13Z-ene-9,15,16-triol synthase, chloroplastic-like isoform X1 [Solanum stenotomum]